MSLVTQACDPMKAPCRAIDFHPCKCLLSVRIYDGNVFLWPSEAHFIMNMFTRDPFY